jgi:hypothetical protein
MGADGARPASGTGLDPGPRAPGQAPGPSGGFESCLIRSTVVEMTMFAEVRTRLRVRSLGNLMFVSQTPARAAVSRTGH